ncbi:MAG TPA: DUF1579 domain-containing protein [Pirellulaceae bacterium]|nr:DUF1579 domain-containing protein [Pirellulaceae bacterium]
MPKPGPEHAYLKAMEGVWDAEMVTPDGNKSAGTMTYKMQVGGLWLTSDYKGEFAGAEFTGKGLDSYDAKKKKYVGVWVDSMITSPLIMEGDMDEKTHTLTMNTEGPGPDGKPQKMKMVTKMPDKDHMNFEMFMTGADGKETSGFKINYTRKK